MRLFAKILFYCFLLRIHAKKVDWSGRMLDSCGNSWTGETPEAQPRRLTASPAESEHPGAEINYYFLLYNSNKLYEKSLSF
ncbi:hypothetical protein F0342_08440 [Bacillus sp. CH30_1T]|nr:hypothetical protein F0342_08440 [Bacillus sp. CH30_1T]